MNKKVLSLIILFFGCWLMANAQEDGRINIKGLITDATTGEPIAFANVGILGTWAGVASNMDGTFELQLPANYRDRMMRVSVVGYRPYEIKVADASREGLLKISLEALTFVINDVNIYGESLVYRKLLRQAAENISRNYIAQPYNYQGYFQYSVSSDGMLQASKEAIVTIYDSKGYKRGDVETAFKELNYRFTEVRRNQEVKSVLDGLMYFDDIITADIVRNTRNVLDIANIRDYKLKNKGYLLYEGDSVQVIGYEVTKPTLSTTGSNEVTKFNGEIYINRKDYAVLKNTMHISADHFTVLGRNLVPVGGNEKTNLQMTVTTNYKKMDSRYFLSGITIKYSYLEDGKKADGKMQYVTTRVNTETPERVNGRMYYEDIKTNPRFWDNYTVYFEE